MANASFAKSREKPRMDPWGKLNWWPKSSSIFSFYYFARFMRVRRHASSYGDSFASSAIHSLVNVGKIKKVMGDDWPRMNEKSPLTNNTKLLHGRVPKVIICLGCKLDFFFQSSTVQISRLLHLELKTPWFLQVSQAKILSFSARKTLDARAREFVECNTRRKSRARALSVFF